MKKYLPHSQLFQSHLKSFFIVTFCHFIIHSDDNKKPDLEKNEVVIRRLYIHQENFHLNEVLQV